MQMLCEGYSDCWGDHHPGFYCPRLSDPPDFSFCCWLGEGLRQCCPWSQYQNISQKQSEEIPKEPLHGSIYQAVVLLYGSLVLVLMLVDFLWFCRVRGFTVTSALRNYITCPHWIPALLFPNDNKTQRYHGNGRRDSGVI